MTRFLLLQFWTHSLFESSHEHIWSEISPLSTYIIYIIAFVAISCSFWHALHLYHIFADAIFNDWISNAEYSLSHSSCSFVLISHLWKYLSLFVENTNTHFCKLSTLFSFTTQSWLVRSEKCMLRKFLNIYYFPMSARAPAALILSTLSLCFSHFPRQYMITYFMYVCAHVYLLTYTH